MPPQAWIKCPFRSETSMNCDCPRAQFCCFNSPFQHVPRCQSNALENILTCSLLYIVSESKGTWTSSIIKISWVKVSSYTCIWTPFKGPSAMHLLCKWGATWPSLAHISKQNNLPSDQNKSELMRYSPPPMRFSYRLTSQDHPNLQRLEQVRLEHHSPLWTFNTKTIFDISCLFRRHLNVPFQSLLVWIFGHSCLYSVSTASLNSEAVGVLECTQPFVHQKIHRHILFRVFLLAELTNFHFDHGSNVMWPSLLQRFISSELWLARHEW